MPSSSGGNSTARYLRSRRLHHALSSRCGLPDIRPTKHNFFVAHGPCEKTVAIDHGRQFVVQGKADRFAAINASKLAKSCASRSMRSAIRNRAAERSAGVVRDQWSDALRAAATARSTCAVEALRAPRIAAHPCGCYGSVRGPLALLQKMNPPAAMWTLRRPLDPSLFAAACGV